MPPFRSPVEPLLALALALLAPPAASPLRAQPAPCDTSLRSRAEDPSGYRLRDGNRCEGVFVRNVSGSSSLRIASVARHYESFTDSAALPLRVEWTAPAGALVQLHGYSLKSGLHYRMETVEPLTGGAYVWPTSVLRSLRMKKPDLGVVAIATVQVGDSARRVHVPVRITQRQSASDTARHQVVLWSSAELSEVFVSVAATDSLARPTRDIQRNAKLGYGFYPAERGIAIRLPPLGAPGIYQVRIGAVRKSGGSATTSFLLYHGGR